MEPLRAATFSKLYAQPASPPELLAALYPGLKKRVLHFIEHHALFLEKQGWLSQLTQTTMNENPFPLFKLVHSPLERFIADLASPESLPVSRDHLRLEIERLLRLLTSSIPGVPPQRFYGIHAHAITREYFPNAETFYELPPSAQSHFQKLLSEAGAWVQRWDAGLFGEIDFLIHDYAIYDNDPAQIYYSSSDIEPGYVYLDPLHLMAPEKQPYPEGSEIQIINIAAQLIHESRHQKGYLFNRALDPTPELAPSPFVKPEHHQVPLDPPFPDFVLKFLFDLILSIGYEFQFILFVKKEFPLGEFAAAFDRKIERKRGFIYPLIFSAEKNRRALTSLGEKTLDEMFAFFGWA